MSLNPLAFTFVAFFASVVCSALYKLGVSSIGWQDKHPFMLLEMALFFCHP